MAYTIRELKTRLSRYIRQVKADDTVIITERGKPVGRLIPLPPSLEARLQGLRRCRLSVGGPGMILYLDAIALVERYMAETWGTVCARDLPQVQAGLRPANVREGTPDSVYGCALTKKFVPPSAPNQRVLPPGPTAADHTLSLNRPSSVVQVRHWPVSGS